MTLRCHHTCHNLDQRKCLWCLKLFDVIKGFPFHVVLHPSWTPCRPARTMRSLHNFDVNRLSLMYPWTCDHNKASNYPKPKSRWRRTPWFCWYQVRIAVTFNNRSQSGQNFSNLCLWCYREQLEGPGQSGGKGVRGPTKTRLNTKGRHEGRRTSPRNKDPSIKRRAPWENPKSESAKWRTHAT